VWGIRSIISPSSQAFVCAIDLSLALVILFLLGAIAVRALTFLLQHARPSEPPSEEFRGRYDFICHALEDGVAGRSAEAGQSGA